MNRNDVKVAMQRIADELIDTDEGAHWLRVVKEFENEYADELDDLRGEILEDYLRLRAKEAVANETRRGNGQITLPGLGEIDSTVTCRDGEGGYRVKNIRRATPNEAVEDHQILVENASRASEAVTRAELRNGALLPIMESEGFVTLGEAIDFLGSQP